MIGSVRAFQELVMTATCVSQGSDDRKRLRDCDGVAGQMHFGRDVQHRAQQHAQHYQCENAAKQC